LQRLCRSTQRPFFYIDHPDDLKCAGPFIKKGKDLKGEITDGPGGALYDYLTQNTKPILILNLSRFKTSDFVQYNSIFDEQPRLEGLDILQDCKIIGLSDVAIATDASITSRFDLQHQIDEEPQSLELTVIDVPNPTVIECCAGLNWESRLIGSWVFDGKQPTYKKGLLWEAIEQGNTALVLNNPPQNDPNFNRLIQDMQFHKALYHQGEKLIDAPNLKLDFTSNRLVTDYQTYLTLSTTTESMKVLNPESLDDFMGRYAYQADTQSIGPQLGLIEQANDTNLNVYLTANLSLEEWRLLILCCKQHHTRLSITLAPNVSMPDELKLEGEVTCTRFPGVIHTQCMIHQPHHLSNALYVDISELTADDLLPGLKRLESAPTELKFEPKPGFLEQQLNEGRTIVLSGDWARAKSLTHALHSFVFERMQDGSAKGYLILVQGEHQAFPFMTATESKPTPKPPVEPSKKIKLAERVVAVRESLKNHPILILTGPTGVGKTHFINQQYPKAHFGEDKIIDWVRDTTNNPATLFIDEANMSHQQWSMFEGLFQKPPGVFYQGTHYPLSENHRVVFAANPLSYGGERQLPSLFCNHRHELEFEPLSAEELLTALNISEKTKDTILPMLNFIFDLKTDKVLLTPREILMVEQLALKHPAQAKDIAYSIFKTHVPKEHQADFQKFAPDKPSHASPQNLKSFVVNPTNQPAVDALSLHLSIRNTRQGGLGGVIIEGEPGVGKSQLVTQLLTEEHRMQEAKDFIRIPISLDYDKKQELLLQAFHQGQIVIIDEINASLMMERLLNALLEGHDLENKPPANPGFMIIGTQNPPSYCGRVQTTLPLKHRLQTVELNEYNQEDMKAILQHQGLSPQKAEQLIVDYEKHKQKQKHNLCFRDLLREARKILDNEKTLQSTVVLDYISMKEQLTETLKKLPINSPVRPYAREILDITQKILDDKRKPIQKNILTDTLQVTLEAINAYNNKKESPENLTKKAQACADQGARILQLSNAKTSQEKKLGGLLLGIAGLLIIIASIAIAVSTYFFATPVAIAGINLGITYISASIAGGLAATIIGYGLFSTRKPNEIQLQEILNKLNQETRK
jgi:MoxR-like ATPase